MIVDLRLEGKYVVVVGGGAEAYRKTMDFLRAGAKILVVSSSFSSKLLELGKTKKIHLRKEKVVNSNTFISSLEPKPDILVAITNNHELNAQLFKSAKQARCIVYSPDNPAISDIALPALAKVEDVQIAVSTGGKSPAVASILRQRIEKLIKPEDLLQIKLQTQLRQSLKQTVEDQRTRKALLYRIIEHVEVNRLLKQNRLEKAKEKALEIINSNNPNKKSSVKEPKS